MIFLCLSHYALIVWIILPCNHCPDRSCVRQCWCSSAARAHTPTIPAHCRDAQGVLVCRNLVSFTNHQPKHIIRHLYTSINNIYIYILSGTELLNIATCVHPQPFYTSIGFQILLSATLLIFIIKILCLHVYTYKNVLILGLLVAKNSFCIENVQK